MRREHSAGIITYHSINAHREYLILHYPGGHFDFPKGHIEEGETEREAAMRELTEETGIDDIIWVDGYHEKIEYQFRHAGHLILKDVVFFLGKTMQMDVKISHEHQDFMWMNYEEAMEKLTFETAKNLLRKAEDILKH